MPIPFILGGAAAVAGLFGAKKMYDSNKNNNEAKALNNEAEEIFYSAQRRLDKQRTTTNAMLEDLGKTRIMVWSEDMAQFVEVFQKFADIEWKGEVANDKALQVTDKMLSEIQRASFTASEVVKAGFGSLASGTLAGVAAYGGVGAFAAASTGTAISTLSGAAATNATLAWLGGGSLAAGGLGVAGGTLVLGGVVAAPVLAVAGLFAASKSKENLARAEKNYAEARNAAEEMGIMTDSLANTYNIAADYNDFILDFSNRFKVVIQCITEIHDKNYEIISKKFVNKMKMLVGLKKSVKVSFNDLTEEEQQQLHISWLLVQSLQALLTQGILDKKGKVDKKATRVLYDSQRMLEEHTNG